MTTDELGVWCTCCGYRGMTGHYAGCVQLRWQERCGTCGNLPEDGHSAGCAKYRKVARDG